jgi:hypothetical protein
MSENEFNMLSSLFEVRLVLRTATLANAPALLDEVEEVEVDDMEEEEDEDVLRLFLLEKSESNF